MCQLLLGSVSDFAALAGHAQLMIARKINASPSVAVALTSGSRAANTGPNTSPYNELTTPPNATHVR